MCNFVPRDTGNLDRGNMTGIVNTLLKGLVCAGMLVPFGEACAQNEKIEPIVYGDMNKWLVRKVDESYVIGGDTKYLYEIASGDTLFNNTPYKNKVSPWATSTVMAKVSGVVKASVTVFPEKRDDGFCARLETRMENCKVLGLINITVLASGTLFLGAMEEPVRDTKNPQSKLMTGIPFNKRPKALMFDYKVETGGKRIRATGFSRITDLSGKDNAETCMLLQHRWEDANGNIYARRVGTAWERYSRSVDTWQNKHRLDVHYGDISSEAYYQPFMGLINGDNSHYCKNSKGEIVPIHEVGWGFPNEEITHIVLRISSSCGGAYVGTPGSKFWVDNVALVY